MSKVAPFSIGPVTNRCLPFRTVKGMGRHQLNPFQNAELVAWAVSQNLAESTSFYDDDVALPWTPQAADFYKDPNSQFWTHPWDSPGKNTGVGCHFLLQCMKVKSESEVAQSCPTLRDPMDCNLPGSSAHEIFQARVLEWVAIAFSGLK